MNPHFRPADRRAFLRGGLALGAAALSAGGAFADKLLRNPELTEGPFYPTKLPLDQDNDLVLLKGSDTPAAGEVTHLTGRILDVDGRPVKNATIEIWQCDAREVYHHTRDEDGKEAQIDKNFQGFGHFTTGAAGEYRFRTIKPVPYPGRPAGHIHYKIKRNGRELLTSQLFVAGAAGNARDGIFRGAGDALDRELVQAAFLPLKGSKTGELAATFDVVIGRTPDDETLERKADRK